MTDETDAETERIALIVRKCDVCGNEAVPLEGIGADCRRGDCSGEYVERTGIQTVEVLTDFAEQAREHYPEAVAE